IALRGIRRPDVQVVAKFRRQEPAAERREELRELDVLPLLDGVLDAERVDVALVEVPLIQVPDIAEETQIHLSLLALEEKKAAVRHVLRRFLLLLLDLLQRLSRGERAGTAVRHPDASVVVAPCLAK